MKPSPTSLQIYKMHTFLVIYFRSVFYLFFHFFSKMFVLFFSLALFPPAKKREKGKEREKEKKRQRKREREWKRKRERKKKRERVFLCVWEAKMEKRALSRCIFLLIFTIECDFLYSSGRYVEFRTCSHWLGHLHAREDIALSLCARSKETSEMCDAFYLVKHLYSRNIQLFTVVKINFMVFCYARITRQKSIWIEKTAHVIFIAPAILQSTNKNRELKQVKNSKVKRFYIQSCNSCNRGENYGKKRERKRRGTHWKKSPASSSSSPPPPP